jgi:hypothetical protein
MSRVHKTTEWWLGDPLATPNVKGLCLKGDCAIDKLKETGAEAKAAHFKISLRVLDAGVSCDSLCGVVMVLPTSLEAKR